MIECVCVCVRIFYSRLFLFSSLCKFTQVQTEDFFIPTLHFSATAVHSGDCQTEGAADRKDFKASTAFLF